MIYTASSVSLAIVEFLCILGPRVLKTHYSLLIFDADVEMEFDPNDLPRDWDTPFQSDSTQLIGRNWSVHYRSVAMKVPSARIPLYVYENEFNILINPIHPRLKAKVKFIQEKHLNFHLGNWAAEK
jgi:RES domain-containing protein